MTDLQKVETAIRNVLAQLRKEPWERPVEEVLAMLADELTKFAPSHNE